MRTKIRYNWDEWFGNKIALLRRGIEYNCSQSAMASMVRNNASMRRIKVRLTDMDTSILVEVLDEVSHTNPATISAKSTPTLASTTKAEDAAEASNPSVYVRAGSPTDATICSHDARWW